MEWISIDFLIIFKQLNQRSMRTQIYATLTLVGFLAGIQAIEIGSADSLGVTPASHNMCPVDGLAQIASEA